MKTSLKNLLVTLIFLMGGGSVFICTADRQR